MNRLTLFSSICLFAATACQPLPEDINTTVSSTAPANTKIFAMVKEVSEQYRLFASTQLNAESAKLCVTSNKGDDCDPSEELNTELLTSKHKIFSAPIEIDNVEKVKIQMFSGNDVLATQSLYIKDLSKADADIDLEIPKNSEIYDWRSEIEFKSTGTYNFRGKTYRSKTYKDVMTYVRQPYLQSTPMTIVHESLHFLLNENAASGFKFIYYKEGQGALFPEPTTVLTKHMDAKLPEEIKAEGKLYNNYVKKRPNQTIGENIVEEWNAYIVEALSLVETVEVGSNMQNDGLEGAFMEAAYYNAAAIHALHKSAPAFFQKKNSRAVFAMLFEQSKIIRDKQKELNMRTSHTEYFANHLANDPASAEIRESMKAVFGQAWTSAILGF